MDHVDAVSWRISCDRSHQRRSHRLVRPAGRVVERASVRRVNTPTSMLPQIVDSVGECAIAHSLPGAPPIVALIGDQQASLIGQGCGPWLAKITFGTGGMLDTVVNDDSPSLKRPDAAMEDVFGIVAWAEGANAHLVLSRSCSQQAQTSIGSETISRSFRQAPRVTTLPRHARRLMASFVPAAWIGNPHWDYGARSTFVGPARTTRAHMVRAVVEGIAHRGADLVEAVRADAVRRRCCQS